jgi:hypothetical protein
MGTILIASTSTIAEIGVIVVIVVLAVVTFVLYRKQNAPAKAASPDKSAGARATNYYSEVSSVAAPGSAAGRSDITAHESPLTGGSSAQADPFATLSEGSAPAAPAPEAAAADSPASFPPAAAGTPAGWLTDPGGAADTLRYWDGNAWTAHVAQRS